VTPNKEMKRTSQLVTSFACAPVPTAPSRKCIATVRGVESAVGKEVALVQAIARRLSACSRTSAQKNSEPPRTAPRGEVFERRLCDQ
jgi:hypothetical protein